MPDRPLPYEVFRQLAREGVRLRACAAFGDGLAAAAWTRNETAETSYILPNHHTLSLYVAGGEGIRRRRRGGEERSFGAGSLCLMPEAVTTDWLVSGPVELFHLYIPRALFDRVVVTALDRDPARVSLPERAFFADAMLEQLIRLTFLAKSWEEPADRLALSHAGHMILAHLIGRYSAAERRALIAKGGLPPRVRRRVEAYIEAYLGAPLPIAELARLAGLSEFHFARMFKMSTGESPHAYVLHRRLERAKALLGEDRLPLAEVALACGFASQSHFSASFRQRIGLTPRRYRQAVRL